MMICSLAGAWALGTALLFFGCGATTVRDIWLSSIHPYTEADTIYMGITLQVGADIMLNEINKKSDLLPGYRVQVAWQNGGCSSKMAADVFLDNIFKDVFKVWAPGMPVNMLNSDGVGEVSVQDVEPFHRQWTSADMAGGPVGLLGGGCSVETMGFNNIAFKANFPIVSGLSTLPGLSDRIEFPNFWRTILPDTNFPSAWMAISKLLGFERITAVIGETEAWVSMAEVVVTTASAQGITLDGNDLSAQLGPGFSGYQISLDSQSAAVDVANSLKWQNNRMVMGLLYTRRISLLLCEMHKLGLDNFIFLIMGWLGAGWWRRDYYADCSPEDLAWMAQGFISANMQFWRSDMDTKLSCSDSMTAAGFQAEWLRMQNITLESSAEGGTTPNGFFPHAEAATVADALCMYAQSLHAMLFQMNFTVEDMQRRGVGAYSAFQESLAAVDFQGISGRIKFRPGSGDPEGSVLVQHLQARTDEFVDIASYSAEGTLSFFGKADSYLMFKLPGETYFAGPQGSTSIDARPAEFKKCGPGTTLSHWNNTCEPCLQSQVFVESMGACACRAGFQDNNVGCVACPAGTFSSEPGSLHCSDCSPGKFSDIGQPTCTRCEIGKYQEAAGMSTCESCPDTFTTMGEGHDDFNQCMCGPGKTQSIAGICEGCRDSFESKTNGSGYWCACPSGHRYDGGAEKGVTCEPHLTCPGGHLQGDEALDTTVTVQQGYMTLASEPFSVFTCSREAQCPGERVVGSESMCAPRVKLTSPRCAVCEEDSALTLDERCAPCPDDLAAELIAQMKLCAFLTLQILFVLFIYKRCNRQKTATEGVIESFVAFVQVLQVISQLDLKFPSVLSAFFQLLDLLSLSGLQQRLCTSKLILLRLPFRS